ncbi:hypothetical protein LOAG_05609 [Loa loa]|uniref:Uncharacterized protein n=1 Tax=Loa loa TaxID=7209 RepID=A0A1S0TZJ8_LOALO|nr:hypothetical protein LOAG_05609 [Loa loa]EFO22878.1 hypothetical protein LOAG_05609 [Loa loa]
MMKGRLARKELEQPYQKFYRLLIATAQPKSPNRRKCNHKCLLCVFECRIMQANRKGKQWKEEGKEKEEKGCGEVQTGSSRSTSISGWKKEKGKPNLSINILHTDWPVIYSEGA